MQSNDQLKVCINFSSGILNVSAVEKGTGKSQKITITGEKGRLSKEDIERMVSEAEKYKTEDELERNRIQARNELESYAYSIRNSIEDEKVKEKVSESDKRTIEKEIKDIHDWLDRNPDASVEEYERRKKELESVCNPIFSSLYGSKREPGFGSSDPGASSSQGPKIEEVD
jgi:L1 cell adhesion molecule like protein